MLEQALRGRGHTWSDGQLYAALRRAGVRRPFAEGPLWLHDFHFAAEPDRVPLARRRVAEFAEDCGLFGEALFDMVLAVGEALANAVEHGSPRGPADMVKVRVGILEHRVVVEVRDSGTGIPDCGTDLPGLSEMRGRGIPFMRSLVDEVAFDCGDGGTAVLLSKRSS